MSLSFSDRPVIRLPVVMMNSQGEFISGEAHGSNPHPKGGEGLPAATPQAPTAVSLARGVTQPPVWKSHGHPLPLLTLTSLAAAWGWMWPLGHHPSPAGHGTRIGTGD